MAFFKFDYFMGFIERFRTFFTVFKMLSWTLSIFFSYSGSVGFGGNLSQFSQVLISFIFIWISIGVSSVVSWRVSFVHNANPFPPCTVIFYLLKIGKISKVFYGFFLQYYFGDDELKRKLREYLRFSLHFSVGLT